MVTGQHQDVLWLVRLQDVQVLVHRVGCAQVPAFVVHALLGGQQVNELVELVAQKAPAALQVAQQAVRFVLRDDAHAAHARVQTIGQREVDDAELAAKVHRRFGAPVGQAVQARAAPACQHQGNGVPCQLLG